ncbi:MAG: 3-dehydroquinate synthase [Treponema sp.]|nr:3-dehydroquinate synthase [Treponema sp.]
MSHSYYEYRFCFGSNPCRVVIEEEFPAINTIFAALSSSTRTLLVCDTNTLRFAQRVGELPAVILESGETAKRWASVEKILRGAYEAGLGRDGLFIGIGGGVVCDLTAFAASVYMRGASLCLIPTTLLAMADASLGGKTGFDLFDIKNLAGTFYPAALVYMPLESLHSLPEREWRSGMAELIKTSVLDEDELMFSRIALSGAADTDSAFLISRAVEIKGRIVEEDPQETGERRALLNLGHTFGHALETSAGLGRLSHGEAVAWGMVRSCELGRALGITPPERAQAIIDVINSQGYETRAPHPLMGDSALFMRALEGDKKKRGGGMVFVTPAERGARLVDPSGRGDSFITLIESLVNGAYSR